MMPTEEEYNKSKKIVADYENEQQRLLDIKVEAFKKDLTEYFKNNKLDGYYQIEEFTLNACWTGNPKRFDIDAGLNACYGGSNNEDIEKLAKKHGIDASFAAWMYPK